MGISAIREVGRNLERTWRARDYALAAFPDLCADELSRARLHEHVTADDVIAAVFAPDIPQQEDPKAKFGQPPVTLFRGQRFFMDVLLWVDGTTAIHDHQFSGAFQVLSGSSIETTFRYEVSRVVDGRICLGELTVKGSSLLSRGDVRPIEAGPSFIHSLFHLARPSVSLVVRTPCDSMMRAQLEYWPVGVANESFAGDEVLDRQVQMVEMLVRTDHPGADEYIASFLREADLHTAFAVVRACARVRDVRRRKKWLGHVKDSDAARIFERWLADDARLRTLTRARADIHDPDLRFFLAVLLNAHRRSDAVALVASYAPTEDPIKQIAAWLKSLSKVTLHLQVAGEAWQPNVLGIPQFEEGFEQALIDNLQGTPAEHGSAAREFVRRLASLPPLAPLFR